MDSAQQAGAQCLPLLGALLNQPQLLQLAEVQWRLELNAKIAAIVEKLREKFAKTQNVCLCQAWFGTDETAVNPTSLEVTLWADSRLGVVLDPLFQDLRVKSCQGPVFFRNSMPGKVWRSGAVQIVQNLRILPPTLHPRSQLSEEALERLAEALYIPIYDLSRPARGQVCVLEVLLSSRATEAMLVADVISLIGNLLTALQLSLANPVQQPVRRSVLCGRRARAPDSDGEASGGEEAGAAGTRPRPQGGEPQGAEPQAGGAGCSGREGTPAQAPAHGQEPQQGNRGRGACAAEVGPSCGPGAAPGDGRDLAAPAAGGQAAAGPCSRAAGEAAPAVSELPTLPASPERQQARSGDPAAAAAGVATAYGPPGVPNGDRGGTSAGVPRKIRKILDGAMQRSKSVASVAALSNGASEDEEEAEAGAGVPTGVHVPAWIGQCGGAGAAGRSGLPLDPRSAPAPADVGKQ